MYNYGSVTNQRPAYYHAEQQLANRNRNLTSDNIYYNVEISNPLIGPNITQNPPVIATYTENLNQPILENPSQYYLTISRFALPGAAIPLLIMQIINNQANPNLTPYTFTLSIGGNDYLQSVIYVPQNNIVAPSTAIPTQIISPYYYVYSYQQILNIFNTALAAAFAALLIANPLITSTEPPFFIYNVDTQLISLIFQSTYIADGIQIFTNFATYTRFINSINVITYGDGSILNLNSKDCQFILIPTYNNGYTSGVNNQYYVPGATLPTYLSLTQEYVTIQYFNSFKNIVFLTGSMPIQYEYVPANGQFLSGSSATGATSFSPILTDFLPLLSAAGNARSILEYVPTGPYRLLSMIGTSPLSRIDVSIFWQDQLDNLYPLMIQSGQSASIKFLFIRRPE